MREKKVSIVSIAKDLGIAPSSVSRALNDRPGVSPDLKERILAHAERIGYSTGSVSRDRSLKIIGMIIGDIRNPFYADLVYHVNNELLARGYQLCIFNSGYVESKEIECLRLAENFHFAGVIQMNIATEQLSRVLESYSLPVVMINRSIASFTGDIVLLDNYEAGYVATRHLIELGHSRIGFILGQKESSSCRQRFAGFQQAMANYNLEVRPSDLLQGDLTMETGLRLASQFHALRERPSAMVVANDLMAHGFVSGCMSMGIGIPDQLSVVAFDNILFSSIGSITLSSIDPSAETMGKTAGRLIVERIEQPHKNTERVVIKPMLIERSSTAPFHGRVTAPAVYTSDMPVTGTYD